MVRRKILLPVLAERYVAGAISVYIGGCLCFLRFRSTAAMQEEGVDVLRLPVSTVVTSSEVALVPVDCVDAGSEWSSCRKVAIGGESSQKNNLKTEMGFLVLIAGNSYWEIKVIAFSVEGRPISIRGSGVGTNQCGNHDNHSVSDTGDGVRGSVFRRLTTYD